MKHSYPTLYLFNNVFFPQTVIPLTVNDGISKDVLLECYEQNQHVLFYHPSTRSKKIGTVGKIILLEHNADGSTSVLVQGINRVELLFQERHLPFPVFEVSHYVDTQESNTSMHDDSIERLHTVLEGWLYRHISSSKERERFLKEMSSPQRLINNLCLLVIKDVELKEIFLSSTSLSDRIRLMSALLKGNEPEVEDIQMSEAIKNFDGLSHMDHDLKNAV